MGAKTNKYIQEIEAATLGFGPPGIRIKGFKDQIKDLISEAETSLQRFNARVKELEKEYGAKAHQASAKGAELEKAINGGDPVMKAIAKEDDERNKKLDNAMKGRRKAIEELKKLFNPFVQQVDEFEDFITKKEKSKNPFKSKKSLPEAKKFIARMRQLQRDMLDMVK